MKLSKGNMIAVVAALAAIVSGWVLAAYGFELVSIPGVIEYREGLWVAAGVLIALAGVLYAGLSLYRGKSE